MPLYGSKYIPKGINLDFLLRTQILQFFLSLPHLGPFFDRISQISRQNCVKSRSLELINLLRASL
jgi:hypothetical protein